MACGCEGAKCRLGPGDDRHGTLGGYGGRKCRCNACREASREYQKAYQEANHEAKLERQKAWRETHREVIRERKKVYQEANPDVQRERAARRRARKASAFIGPAFTRQQVWDRDGGTCHLCNLPADPNDWHMDHVIPLVRGGAHSFENAAVSHPTCNLRKGARLLDELDELGIACTISTVSH